LPLALSGATLLVWMRESGVNLATIGLFALVGTPYTVKFLWAPLTDALDVPILSRLLGRRRGCLVFTQILLMAAIVFLAFCNPAVSPALVAFGALLVATASATQDIVVDAFRVESLPENEQAAGMASYVAAIVSALIPRLERRSRRYRGFRFHKPAAWRWGDVAMAGLVVIGIITALRATEPGRSVAAEAAHAREKPFARVVEAAVGAFKDFLSYRLAFVMLAFVVLFKFTDALSGAMTAPFVIDLGFTRNEYAAIVKGVGLAALLVGGFAGGFIARALPLAPRPWIGRLLPPVATLSFRALPLVRRYHTLAVAIAEELSPSARWRSLPTFALCRNRCTHTQYAAHSAGAVGRTIVFRARVSSQSRPVGLGFL
jgi:PAT family beta-lactamase induction signal transducer AmpG